MNFDTGGGTRWHARFLAPAYTRATKKVARIKLTGVIPSPKNAFAVFDYLADPRGVGRHPAGQARKAARSRQRRRQFLELGREVLVYEKYAHAVIY